MAVGGALVALAMKFCPLRALRLMCIPWGLAAAHFRWPEPSVRLLHPKSGVFAHAARGAQGRRLPFLYPFWYPLPVIAPPGAA